jgi:uncharacterized membrane protein
MGCKKSEEGGRAGTDTFQVVVPLISTYIKQGEFQIVRVSVERGAEFKQAVTLKMKVPTGLTIDPDNSKIEPGDRGSVQLKITAAKDAPLGDQIVRVMGTPDKGETAETAFTVTVSAK